MRRPRRRRRQKLAEKPHTPGQKLGWTLRIALERCAVLDKLASDLRQSSVVLGDSVIGQKADQLDDRLSWLADQAAKLVADVERSFAARPQAPEQKEEKAPPPSTVKAPEGVEVAGQRHSGDRAEASARPASPGLSDTELGR